VTGSGPNRVGREGDSPGARPFSRFSCADVPEPRHPRHSQQEEEGGRRKECREGPSDAAREALPRSDGVRDKVPPTPSLPVTAAGADRETLARGTGGARNPRRWRFGGNGLETPPCTPRRKRSRFAGPVLSLPRIAAGSSLAGVGVTGGRPRLGRDGRSPAFELRHSPRDPPRRN
jgi:hypothetical protein